MQIWNVPVAFKDAEHRLTCESGIEIILYRAGQETEKANIQFGRNGVVLLLCGCKEVITPNQTVQLQAGEGFFLKKGHYLMSEKFATENYYESLIILFEDAIVQKLASEWITETMPVESSYPELIKIPASEYVSLFAHSVKSYFTPDLTHAHLHILLQSKLQELFWLLTHSAIQESFIRFLAHLHKNQVHTIEHLIEQHYKKNISLEQLAFLGGYSLSTFKRRFEEVYQTSPRKWIQERRLQEAYFLLKTTGKNVSEVCLDVGFENVSHFVQAFKEKYGHTPKQFRSAHTLG